MKAVQTEESASVNIRRWKARGQSGGTSEPRDEKNEDRNTSYPNLRVAFMV